MQAFDVTAVIAKLERFVLGDKPSAMSAEQVEAALGLLNKAMPDLVAVSAIGHESAPVGTILVSE